MTTITISGTTAERLQQIAQDAHRTVEEILEDALNSYVQAETDSPPPGSLARMAQIARQNPIEVENTDIAEHSRDILRSEYGDHLLKRQNNSDDSSDE